MIDRDRLTQLFIDLTLIDNPSLREGAMCGELKKRLDALGIRWQEDDAGARLGGECGNLYGYMEGTLDLAPILLSAHMDCVDPACGKKAVLHPDGTITSDGTTVLGADDLSGVAAILEALTVLREDHIPHRPVEVLFDVSEETYCTGIQQFDFAHLKSNEAYVFDLSGPVGGAANRAPTIVSFRADFHGRAAHAAFAPEDGIHAIRAAAEAIRSIPCGHIEDATVNIGTVSGGIADNIVPETCTVTGEVRSFSDESAQTRLASIEEAIQKAAADAGATVEFFAEQLCMAYHIDPAEPVVERFRRACADAGLESRLVSTYGGSDNNHFAQKGIRGLVVAPGMNRCHSCQEYTTVDELERAARLALAMILSE